MAKGTMVHRSRPAYGSFAQLSSHEIDECAAWGMAKKKKGNKSKGSKNYAKLENETPVQSKKNGRNKGSIKGIGATLTTGGTDYSFRQSVEDGTRTILDMAADGNCLFRSLSDQLYHDYGNSHEEVRSEVCDFIEAEEEEFAVFVVLDEKDHDEEGAEDFDSYVSHMRQDGSWGGNLELVAASRLYRRNIVVFSAMGALTIEHGETKTSETPDMMVSYHENDHYNSVRSVDAIGKTLLPIKVEVIKKKPAVKEDESKSKSGDEKDATKGGATEESTPKKPLKKNDPCRCGSGLRYKKCCLPADKSKERSRKWKEKQGLEEAPDKAEEDQDDDEEESMHGNFKVLKI